MIWDVYMHTSPSGRRYVGISAYGIHYRWASHVSDAGRGSKLALHRAIRKYGADAFRSEVLAQVATEAEAKALEIECIAAAGSLLPTGYNATAGGDGMYGKPVRAETRAKISASLAGRPLTDECKAKISAALRGRTFSDETRARISASRKGLSPSAAWREKLSAANTGKRASDEARAKMSAAGKGRKKPPISEATRARMSAAARNRRTNPTAKPVDLSAAGQ